jgi:hypothetical protein
MREFKKPKQTLVGIPLAVRNGPFLDVAKA